jgi:hypothetical protein
MLEREFIPYDRALALKELGFDEPCLTYYNYDKRIERSDDWAHGCTLEDKRDRNECLAPLYQQAFKWFREKYNLMSVIGYHNIWKYSFLIQTIEEHKTIIVIDKIDTYEEAELACIDKLIQLVKEAKEL